MMDEEQILEVPASLAIDAALVPLPETPNDSFANMTPAAADTPAQIVEATIEKDATTAEAPFMLLQSPSCKISATLNGEAKAKPMSPEKAALAAMFDSIKMPPPISPSRSPRKASGSSSILNSPSKQLASSGLSLFRSPAKASSSDSAASRHFSRDSPMRRPVVISSSSPSHSLGVSQNSGKKASTPLSPARTSAPVSSSSPSARLSDLSILMDTTGTQEMLFNSDTSFLNAAANTAADVTIDDSFDVSRAKARINSRARSSPAKFAGSRSKPRCSMVPEEGVAMEFKSASSPARRERNALGLRGLGIGRVVKNAAGDDTIELNLTGSFIGNSSMIGGNLMDESGEASLLFGNNSFSISHSGKVPPQGKQQEKKTRGRTSSGDEDDDDDEEQDFEKEAKSVRKWAAEAAARNAQLGRSAVTKPTASSVSRPTNLAPGSKPVSRVAPRPSSLVTPTAGSRLLKPRSSAVPAARPVSDMPLPRSGSASSLASSVAVAATPSKVESTEAAADDLKTPMRSRRKSTFTSSRPPVSGPARRRESLAAAAAGVQPQAIPPLPSLGPVTPGRTRTISAPTGTPGRTRSAAGAGTPPSMKTPTAATWTISKPRSSLTGRTGGSLATPRAATVGPMTSIAGAGAIPRPRPSLTSTTTAAPRTTLSSSSAVSSVRRPSARTTQIRSASIAATPRAATARTSAAAHVEATPSGMRKSASQPQGLVETPSTVVPRTRTLVPRASVGSTTSTAPRASMLTTPRAAGTRPSGSGSGRAEALTEGTANGNGVSSSTVASGVRSKIGASRTSAASGGFGFKPRTSAVFVGPTRGASLLADEDKEN